MPPLDGVDVSDTIDTALYQLLFIVFRSQHTHFFSPKIRKITVGQNNKYNTTKTSGLTQVCPVHTWYSTCTSVTRFELANSRHLRVLLLSFSYFVVPFQQLFENIVNSVIIIPSRILTSSKISVDVNESCQI